MKLFIYSHLGKDGKPQYQKIEISDSEAEEWVQVDFEKRRKADPTAVKRTAQEIQDSIDREFLNSDRREYSHRARPKNKFEEEGNELDFFETVADPSPSPEENTIREKELEELLEKIRGCTKKNRADVFIQVVLRNEPLKCYAERNGLSYDAARMLLSRAKDDIRKKFS